MNQQPITPITGPTPNESGGLIDVNVLYADPLGIVRYDSINYAGPSRQFAFVFQLLRPPH